MFTEFMYIALAVCLLLCAGTEDDLAYGLSFGALLGASIINNSDWLNRKLLLESKFGHQRGFGLINSVKKVSITTCKPLLKSLCFSFIHLLTTCNPHFWPKNAF